MRIYKYLNILTFLLCAAVVPARAQFVGYTSPQTVYATPLSAVSAPTTAVVSNLGQNMHYLTYTTTGSITVLDIRLEGSRDGTTFFPISDDATDVPPAFGQVFAIGSYPVVRVNLAAFSGSGSITATYSGTSATAGTPLGVFNPSQQVRRVVFSNVAANANQVATINAPFGSTLGYILITATGLLPAGSSFTASNVVGNVGLAFPVAPSLTTAATQNFAVPADPATQILINYTSGGASASTFNMYYVFVNPNEPSGLSWPNTQPATTLNAEVTSSANAAVTKSVTAVTLTRVHLFTVSARCSAGTASLTVKDGVAGTTIWTTAAADVGTTTFKFQWNPSLSSSLGNGMDVVLGACGASNTGTLDVQESQF
jgi:hypothetical protein